MEERESRLAISEGEHHVFVACLHIVRALSVYKNLNTDLRKLLSDLDTHLSKMTLESKSGESGFAEFEERFKVAEEKVLTWQSNQSIIWDSCPGEAAQYLQAICEIQTVVGSFKGLLVNGNKKQRELYNEAESILQIAMLRLEKELCHVLDKNKQDIEPNYAVIRSHRKDVVYDESCILVEDESLDEGLHRGASNKEHEEHIQDLICPNVIPYIKSIANAMFACGYYQEFCEAFTNSRRDALEDYLNSLEMKKFTITDVLKLDREFLNSKIRKWIHAVRIIMWVYLPGEEQLCEQILGNFESVSPFCFTIISKPSILSLLNFGDAVAMGSYEPEKLFCLLDMCEVLTNLLLDIDSLLLEGYGTCLKIEFHELSQKLGDAARKTLIKFKNAVASHESSSPLPGGGVHPLTRYVMNYIRVLPKYCGILNSVLENQRTNNPNIIVHPTSDCQDASFSSFSPMGSNLLLIASVLEANLHKKSKLYSDDSLQHIFLLNNLHYMAQKVKGSELRAFFGNEWIKQHNAKFQQHTTNYERATWSSVLSLLRDDRLKLKERCKLFGLVFEDLYRNQTGWSIPDPQLRDDVRISSSLKVIQSYRFFLGKNEKKISEKHIKYTVEELEILLLDFFEGSSRSLRSLRRT